MNDEEITLNLVPVEEGTVPVEDQQAHQAYENGAISLWMACMQRLQLKSKILHRLQLQKCSFDHSLQKSRRKFSAALQKISFILLLTYKFTKLKIKIINIFLFNFNFKVKKTRQKSQQNVI